ncbi:MAG: cyclic nucleotide-binding domain-containing protein, partial [Vicinamibacterales bacterium]|nr:cyclic nucleotide-binding domain-containing protein [Vicinamibacterales bacterium]
PLIKGQALAEEADPPALCVVLSGELSLEAPSGTKSGEPVVAKPGDAIGVFETLAGVSIGRRAEALSDGIALHIGHDDLFDLLAHRPALLRQFFGALFGA